MKTWEELSRVEKTVFGFLLLCAFILIPEASFLMGIGGVDLGLFILIMYGQNIKRWYESYFGILKYPIIETKTYVKSISLTSIFFIMTSSLMFSSSFFMLFMFVKKDF